MKSFIVLLCSIFLSTVVIAQRDQLINAEFNNADFNTVKQEIENQTGTTLYYNPIWFDSLSFTGSFVNATRKEVLTSLLTKHDIHFIIDNRQVFLTQGIQIIEQPAIANFEKSNDKAQNSTAGLIFSRDYQQQQSNLNDIEQQVLEVGNRSKYVVGGKSTLVGYVKSQESGTPIAGALIYTEDFSKSSSTNDEGFYAIDLPNGKNTLLYQYLGTKPTQRKVVIFSDGQINVNLAEDVITLSELTVESNKDANIQEVIVGVNKIDIEETKSVPVVLGEKDVLKIATTYAGVQTVGEGASGFNVRGGKSDQNLILFDGATIYNANHFFGFFSAFNSDALQNLEIYKSSIPSYFGGRLSSVFDIESKKANQEKFKLNAGISPITSKFTAEIPIVKGVSGLTVGGRTTYSNWILRRSDNVNFRENRASFSDFNARYDHKINETSELTISGYYSTDKFRLTSDTLFSFSDFQYENLTASIQYKKFIGDKLEGTVSAHISDYGYELLNDESPTNAFSQDFDIREISGQARLSYFQTEKNVYSGGIGTKNYLINPGSIVPVGSDSEVIGRSVESDRGLESFLFVSHEREITTRLSISAGLRYSLFNSFGAKTIFTYQENAPRNSSTVTDTLTFSKGETIQTYHGPEYRFSARYTINTNTSIKFAANRNRQYINSLSNAASLSPTDIYTLSGFHLEPQISDQISVGLFKNYQSGKIELSLEGYYKNLQNLIDFKTGSDFLLNSQIETAVLQGPGKSYGAELSVKKSGKLNGWFNYTYARTLIQLDGFSQEETVNQGAFFPANYDKPHTINLVLNYKATQRLSFSLNSIFQSGRPVTFPTGLFNFRGSQLVSYGDRNTFRIPNTFRVDLGVNLDEGHKIKKLYHSFWSFSIYNLLGRDNPYSVFFDVQEGEVNGFQLVVFGNPIPTISFNIRF